MVKRSGILIVDDELYNIKTLTSALKDDYNILTALNGYDAIDQLKEHHPDLILLDIMMPDIDGFEVCKLIKSDEAFSDIPIIFLTALDTYMGESQGLELGGTDYLVKPINFSLLKLRIRNHILFQERHQLVKEQRDLLIRQKEELENAFARIKQLEGIIPICMYCKKIKDNQNSWQQLERYITEHSEALFSHGMCPDCFEKQMKIVQNNLAGSTLKSI